MCGECGGKKVEKSTRSPCCQPRPTFDLSPSCTSPNQQHTERNSCIGDHERQFVTKNEQINCVGPNEPYHIPGYAGHVPTLQNRQGGTFGQETHEVLTSRDEVKPAFYTKTNHVCPAPLHQPYRIPGYTGHVPGLQNMVGGTYGQDTHKLLYSPEPYPNRQENLSSYKPQDMKNCIGKGGTGRSSTVETKSHVNGSGSSSEQAQNGSVLKTYKKPDEHYLRPQYKYRIGHTYATTADITLVDPCVNQESKVVVPTRELDDTQVVRTHNCVEERVKDKLFINRPVRHLPTIPGFDAYIDALRGSRGQNFEFSHQSPSHVQLQQQLILEKGSVKKPRKADEPSKQQNENQQCHPVSGGDDIPFGYRNNTERPKFTNSALYDFSSNYRRRQGPEWAPAGISRPDPPALELPGAIYSQHTGLLPGYSAHVPGATFRCGKNFTDDSRDARRALRGDRL